MPGFIVWNGRIPVNFLELKDARTLIGRARSNDIVLASNGASHFHATVIREGSVYRVLNHGTHGTYVNDELVPPGGTILAHEDAVRFGDTELTFYLQPPIDGPTGNLVLPPHLIRPPTAPRVDDEFPEIVGDTPAMHVVFGRIRTWGPEDLTVLIEGDTGTGKELVARALHRCSPRAGRKLVPVNMGALPRDLVASELFGHKKGSFTGATSDRVGYFERADGGTIFIDEIGDASPEVQVALLRVLQEQEITRVGDTEPRKVNVRVVAATHRNLRAACENGTFRDDLYFRLCACTITLPSLAERREDIPRLVMRFLEQHGRGKTITSEALALLQDHHWPGNVRELEGAIRSTIPYADRVLEPKHFSHMKWAARLALLLDRTGLSKLYAKVGYSQRRLSEIIEVSRYRIEQALAHLGIEAVKNPGGRRKKKDPEE